MSVKRWLTLFALTPVCSVSAENHGTADADGLVTLTSPYAFEETVQRIEAEVRARGLKRFASIDHRAGAKEAGLGLPPTTTLVFGNPKVGTPLMHCERRVAIDLPQKLLIWQEADSVRVAYNDPRWLARRHGIDGCEALIDKIASVLSSITDAAIE